MFKPRFLKKTPLAWLQVKRERTRLMVAIAGIAFADMLIFIQMGFEGALYDAAIQPHRNLQADLVLTNPQMQTLFSVKDFPRQRLYQTLAHEDVASVSGVYIATGQWKNPETRLERAILVWGIDPTEPSFNFPEVNQNLHKIQPLNQLLFDQAGRPEYGFTAAAYGETGQFSAELNGMQVDVTGVFTNGASFAADGNVIASDSTFLRLFPDQNADHIEVGLVQLKPGADVEKVQHELTAALPDDVLIGSPEDFAQIEREYWANGTGIGFIFGLGVGVGFIVGIVIVYQILYSDVSEHLPEYATLKAMGYTDSYLLSVLIQESLLLAVLGYVPSIVLAFGLYQLAFTATMLPIAMTSRRAVTVLILTIVMCSVSGAIAMRKLRTADPADIF
ncbi:ABC transporter permease DevC [Leptothoe sp. ISB3NOV94-8A]|uniref:ABC transporter n=1 Tax=Adonisia turfae CCMR0081 TaxID=2292702 RepID=A0A6M0RVQ4_9CYAN|nr:ABC transporter permease DevC [Adonisia turfae]NEZ60318.1 ABC transporter [Adonisia turfae CCMR0081]